MKPDLQRILILLGFIGPIIFVLSIVVFGSMFPGYSQKRD